MKKNEKIYAKTILAKDNSMQLTPVSEVIFPKDKARALVRDKHYSSVAERVAESSVCFRNFKFKGALEAFPSEPTMRTVEQYFPYAVGGELLVDSPNNDASRKECARKAIVLAKLGYRYLIVESDMDEFQALEQLEGT